MLLTASCRRCRCRWSTAHRGPFDYAIGVVVEVAGNAADAADAAANADAAADAAAVAVAVVIAHVMTTTERSVAVDVTVHRST